MRIGIMGGTFDPPHLGHILPISQATKEFKLDQVQFIPVYIPPHKSREYLTDPFHRAAMVALAIREYPKFVLSTIELVKGRPSYTVETMHEIKQNSGATDTLFFIMGSDSFLEIQTWHDYRNLLGMCEFIIINRGHQEEELKQNLQQLSITLQLDLNRTIHFSGAGQVPVSSTQVRTHLLNHENIAGTLIPEVEVYISRHRLYERR